MLGCNILSFHYINEKKVNWGFLWRKKEIVKNFHLLQRKDLSTLTVFIYYTKNSVFVL